MNSLPSSLRSSWALFIIGKLNSIRYPLPPLLPSHPITNSHTYISHTTSPTNTAGWGCTQYRPPMAHFPAAKVRIKSDKEGEMTSERRRVQSVSGGATDHTNSSSQVMGNDVAGSCWTGASCSPATGAEPLGTAPGHHDGEERRSLCEVSDDAVAVATTSTRVQPMLLLSAVSESTMSQLVLTAWEQSSINGTSESQVNVEKEGHAEESRDRKASRRTSLVRSA